ncbi:MAG: AbgT family transporter [Myxococcales bacterium]|nr:AbgT family transporter [Myxococcales bacterium]
MTPPAAPRRIALDWIERLGNRLPEPALLFVILAAAVIAMCW